MASISNADAIYGVKIDARPSNYLVNHISWPLISENLNWYNVILTRNTTGYPQTPDDGVRIYTSTTDSVILGVASVNSGGTIATAAGSVTKLSIGAASGKTLTSVDTVQTNSSLGRGAKVSIDGSDTPSIGSISDIGSGYKVGDIIRIPSNTASLGGRDTITDLGVKNAFHVYDTGATAAVTTNPGYGVTGTDLKAPKYYYSLFVTYFTDYTYTPNAKQTSSAIKWKKLGEVACTTVKSKEVTGTNGFVSVKSTRDVLLEHLPKFYTTLSTGSVNKDLSDFITLLAFHIDSYLAKNSSVFSMSDLKNTDNILLLKLLDQFGALYKNTTNLTQARALLANLVHSYEYSGSLEGISNYLEAYSGNSVTAISGKNILLDYNTSSFVESLGSWYPDPDYASYPGYFFNPPYYYTTGDGSSGYMELSDLSGTACDTFANFLSPVAYDQSGINYNYCDGCSSTTTTTTVTVNGNNITNTTATITTTGSTSKIIPGAKVLIIGGTGVLATGTVVTAVIDDKTFTINKVPSTGITGGTLAFSNSLSSKAMKVRSLVASNPIRYYSGLRKAYSMADTHSITGGLTTKVYIDGSGGATTITSTTITFAYIMANIVVGSTITRYNNNATHAIVGSKVTSVTYDLANARTTLTFDRSSLFTEDISVEFSDQGKCTLPALKPLVAKVGDYISTGDLDTLGNSTALAIPYGTTVTAVGVDGTLTLSDSLVDSIGLNSIYYLSKNPITRKPGSADCVPILSNTPYAFGIHFNANTSATKATTVELTWFDSNGALISTSTALTAAPTSSSPVSQTNYTSKWYPSMVTAISPSTAAYCQPSFIVSSASDTNFMYVDGAYLAAPVKVYSVFLQTNVVTVTTSAPHNFKSGNKVAVYIENGSIFNNDAASITSVTQNTSTGLYQFTYTLTNADISVIYPTAGYVASIPMVDDTSLGLRLTQFEDARTTKLNVLANRVNRVPNPSFEVNTSGWAAVSNVSSISRITTDYRFTSACLKAVCTSGVTPGDFAYTSSSPSIKVVEGKRYSASAYLKLPVLVAGTTALVKVEWFSSAGILSSTSGTATVIDDTWTRVSYLNLLAPTGAKYAKLHFIIDRTNTSTASDVYLDAVLFEESAVLTPYFDGDFDGYSYESTKDSVWENAPTSGPSHLYLNRVANQGNIETRVTDMIYYG